MAGGVDPISYVHKKETRERDHAHLVENNECRARRLDGPRERPAVVKIRRSPERDFERIFNGGDGCELARACKVAAGILTASINMMPHRPRTCQFLIQSSTVSLGTIPLLGVRVGIRARILALILSVL